MKNIKVAIAPPYSKTDKDTYISKVEMSAEFDDEAHALNFVKELNTLIIKFNANKE